MALILAAVAIKAAGYDVAAAFANLWDGAFGNTYNFSETLVNTIPIIYTGLSVAIAFRAGLFNIGAEGQMTVAALTSAVVALQFASWTDAVSRGVPGAVAGSASGTVQSVVVSLVPVVAVVAALLAGALAGAAWGYIAGALKSRTGAHEVITTIMMNYVALLLTTYLVKYYLKAPGPVTQTPLIPGAARLPALISGTRLTWALPLGVLLIAAAHWVFKRSRLGYELEAIGENPSAAEYAGIDVGKRTSLAMALSGAAAGLAGSAVVLGVLNRFIAGFSPGYGYMGIAVALLARNHPWAILPAALLFGALQNGGVQMQLFARIPGDLMSAVQGLVILFAAAPALFAALANLSRRSRRRAPKERVELGKPSGTDRGATRP